MTLLLFSGPTIPTQVSRSRGVGVTYEFVKRTMIPGVELEINSFTNISGVSDDSDVSQYKQLKDSHQIGIPFLIFLSVKLH